MKRKESIFSSVPLPNIPRNLFDLSHEVKMTCKFGLLYPVFLEDTLPGDTWRSDSVAMARMLALLSPVMHEVKLTMHFFFVPNRLLTDVWEDFITRGQEGDLEPVLPYVTPAGVNAVTAAAMGRSTLWHNLGLPPLYPGTVTSTEQISALPFRAYAKVWNDWYRDPNFDEEIDLDTEVEGDVSAATTNAILDKGNYKGLMTRMWRRDYFTSALADAQRGPEVLLPLSGLATHAVKASDGTPVPDDKALGVIGLPPGEGRIGYADSWNPGVNAAQANILLDNSEVSINDTRLAFAIQRWMENNARGGARYNEQILTHFRVKVPDYRLQRSEYLGGGKQKFRISEVLSTAETEDVPVGDLRGHGVSVGNTNRFTYRCEEHGWIIGIMSITPDTAYYQGIERKWSRRTWDEFAWPELAHLGEQPVLSKEVFFSPLSTQDAANNAEFGYQPRYSEYKFANDKIRGEFTNSLEYWHLGRKFTSRPTLGSGFTSMHPDGDGTNSGEVSYDRIFAVQDSTDYIVMQIFHKTTAKRPLPYFGVPRLIA